MPELVRTIANRLREFVGNRRYAPRRRTHLPITVSLLEKKPNAANSATRQPSLTGRTHDLSATGLGLILPVIRIGGRYLTGDSQQLHINLELPARPVVLHAIPARYERLETDDSQTGYFIGARITHIADADRALLLEYIDSLAK
ncbi:MAG TPA: PilZ domain-containing protein [Pyrinomonadaceae bacterium]